MRKVIFTVFILTFLLACEPAVFNNTEYYINSSTNGHGTITISPQKTSYNIGENVTITANPTDGNIFSSWSGYTTSSNKVIDITINSDIEITADFDIIVYDIRLTRTPISSNLDGSFAIDFKLKNYGNTTVTITSGAYFIYGSLNIALTDILLTKNNFSPPVVLLPGMESNLFELDGKSSYIPYTGKLLFYYMKYNSEMITMEFPFVFTIY